MRNGPDRPHTVGRVSDRDTVSVNVPDPLEWRDTETKVYTVRGGLPVNIPNVLSVVLPTLLVPGLSNETGRSQRGDQSPFRE